jgi:hypothetical protein
VLALEQRVLHPRAEAGQIPAAYDGGCLCGALRYRVSGDPLTLYACHCTDCQRQSGSAFVLSMIVARDALELLQGEPRRYDIGLADGRRKRGRFCGDCGTRLWGEPVKFPRVAVVRPGTLDDTTWLDPIGHIWTRSAQPWVSIPEHTLNFEGQPGPMDLIKAWRERARG